MFSNMPGGVGPTPTGGSGEMYNNTGDHLPKGYAIQPDFTGTGLASLSLELQTESGVWGVAVLPTTALMATAPIFIVTHINHEDNDRKRVTVGTGGLMEVFVAETSGGYNTKLYAQNGSGKLTTSSASGRRLVGVTVGPVATVAGQLTKAWIFGAAPAAAIVP